MNEDQLWDLWHEFTANKARDYPSMFENGDQCPCCTREGDHDSECELELWVLDFIKFIATKTQGEQT
jgi:hypothetical protein